MHVEGDERHAGTDDGGTGGRVGQGLAEVREPLWFGQLLGEPFELVPPNLFEAPAFRSCSRLFVQKDRHAETFRNLGAELAGQADTFRHRCLAERYEGNHIDGTNAGVDAAVRPQVDARDGNLEQAEQSLPDRARIAGDCEDRTVVRRISGVVEQQQAVDPPEGAGELSDDVGALPFADVGY